MATIIKKIKLINYKRFESYTIEPNEQINIFVGDNEVGKSSILEAIDLVSNGNIRRVEAIGLDRLLNMSAIQRFCDDTRSFENLPSMHIELYLDGEFDHTMNGKNNTDGIKCDGIRLVCEPNRDFYNEINESINEQADYFPYDYYTIRFSTFADDAYSGYKKKIRTVLIDSTNMNSDYATNDFIKRMYSQYTEKNIKERAVHKSKYRQLKNSFQTDSFKELNDRIPPGKDYAFGLRMASTAGLENDLMIFENAIGVDSKGTGKQVFIKTDFALEHSGTNVDVILIEEPENHLSHTNLRKLLDRVSGTRIGQIFVTTHNSLISTRLELKNLLIMHEKSENSPLSLHGLNTDTAKYFLKAPVANIIEFTISNKVILVEGPSEYMLFENFYITIANHRPEEDDVHIIDVRGLSFKRYLEVAKLLNSKVAVVTDNDGDMQKNCIDKYVDFSADENIHIFYDEDNNLRTFEIVLYNENEALCELCFGENPLGYMLNNKTEAAYTLLEQDEEITVPGYIKDTIEWIKN